MTKCNIKRRHSKTLDLSFQKRNRSSAGNIFDGEHNFGAVTPVNNYVSNFVDINKLNPEQAKLAGFTPTNNNLASSSFSTPKSGFDASDFIGKAGNVVSGVTSIIDSSLKNAQIADTTGIESNIKDLRDTDFSEATDSDSLINAYNNLNFLKDDYSWKDVRGVSNRELFGNTLSATGSGAMAGASVGGPWGAVAGAAIGLGGGLAGIFAGKNKAKRKARFLNQAAEAANNQAIDNYDFQVNDIMQNNARNAMKYAYAAEGGPINIKKNISFEDWYKTVPIDRNDTTAYNLRRAYELAPFDELEAWRTSSVKDLNSGKNHLRSVYLNPDTGIYEFMKSKNHPTLHFETDWYNSNDPEAIKFRNNYNLDMNGDYYKYVPKKKAFGGELNTNGGWLGTGLNENVATALSFVPVVGTLMDGAELLAEPSWENAGWFLSSLASDIFTGGAGKAAFKSAKLAKAAAETSRALKSKRIASALRYGNSNALDNLRTARMHSDKAKMYTKDMYDNIMKGLAYYGADAGLNATQQSTKANGGFINTHGGDFSNGVTFINNGGTHEQNPFEGVPMGVAPDGQPNLVEEGEVLYNDYVFSNRLHPTDKELKESNLPKKYKGHTFALIAEDMSKESAERPNDPISKRGLEASLGKLASLQEEQRMKKGKIGTQQMMACGGRKFAGTKNTFSRYAPIFGSAIGAVQSVFQKPDYTNSDLILNAVNNLSRNKVSPTLLNEYLNYNPIDRNYYLNQLKAQSGATRRALMNSGINPGQRMAGLLAADYNAQQGIADTLLKSDMYNEQLKQNIAQFNRGTSQYNSGALMQAASHNAQLAQARDNMRLSGISTAANMRELADTALATSRSANLTNFFDNLGALGRENRDTNMLQTMMDSDLFGTLSESMRGGWRKNGGMLTKRCRKRRK